MRWSTRKADRVRVPLIALVLTMAACTAAAGAAKDPVGDHSRDAGERNRAALYPAEDHSLDRIEAQKDRAFAP